MQDRQKVSRHFGCCNPSLGNETLSLIHWYLVFGSRQDQKKRNQNHIIGDKFCSDIEFLVFVKVEIEIEKEK